MAKKKIRSPATKPHPKTAKRRRGPGKPFVKNDPRINRFGPIKTNVLAFNRTLRELIVAEGEQKHTTLIGDEGHKVKVTFKKVEWMVKVVWNCAMKGEAWAVEFIAERTEGKITQPVDGNLNVTGALSMTALKKSLEECEDGKI